MTGVRSAQKRVTRTKIINSALKLMTDVGNAAAVSMREVAREAGIAPTSFYRHFKDLDEVNLALVEEIEEQLNALSVVVMSNCQKAQANSEQEQMRFIVESFVEQLTTNSDLFRFFLGARYSCSRPVRQEVDLVLQRFVNKIAESIEQSSIVRKKPLSQPRVVAEALVSILFGVGYRAHDMHEDERPFLVEVIIQQIKMLWCGADLLCQQAQMDDIPV